MDHINAGGRAGLTKALRIQYGKYNTDAQLSDQVPLDWPDWLNQNGYDLDESGLAKPSVKRADEIMSKARPYL